MSDELRQFGVARHVDIPAAADSTPIINAQAGELWLIGNAAGERAVVAIAISGNNQNGPRHIVSVAMCSEPGPANDQSLAYASAETGAPYPVLVHTDLCGPIARTQLIRRVGVLPDEDSVLLEAIEWGEFAPSLDGRRGMPLRGPLDARYALIKAEGERLFRFLDGGGLD
jgi:hypothetical protein